MNNYKYHVTPTALARINNETGLKYVDIAQTIRRFNNPNQIPTTLSSLEHSVLQLANQLCRKTPLLQNAVVELERNSDNDVDHMISLKQIAASFPASTSTLEKRKTKAVLLLNKQKGKQLLNTSACFKEVKHVKQRKVNRQLYSSNRKSYVDRTGIVGTRRDGLWAKKVGFFN